jgi:UDP-N-acetylmuramyl pentapeptide phosphotransferase/UDP-N-acetylglucosamine-1-phosphate transferase
MVCGWTIRVMTWIVIAVPFLLSAWLTWRFANPASRFYIIDHPNERSLHVQPTPRSGGVAILFAVIAGWVLQVGWSGNPQGLPLWSGLTLFIVATVSFLDDHHHVSVIYRLVSHIVAAGLLLVGGLSLQVIGLPGVDWALSAWIGACLSLLFVVWMINMYNFMDGMDGFAGGMAVSGFVTFSIFGWLAGHEQYATVSAVTAAAAAGFLCFNFPPARIFMGDIGSSTLGLLAAMFSLWGAKDGVFPFWIALLVFSPFMADATVTLLRRLWKRELIWEAHKSHYYQELVQSGWGHRKTVLVEYVIMIGCAVTALWAVRAAGHLQAVAVGTWILFYFLFFFWVSRFAARNHSNGADRDPSKS